MKSHSRYMIWKKPQQRTWNLAIKCEPAPLSSSEGAMMSKVGTYGRWTRRGLCMHLFCGWYKFLQNEKKIVTPDLWWFDFKIIQLSIYYIIQRLNFGILLGLWHSEHHSCDAGRQRCAQGVNNLVLLCTVLQSYAVHFSRLDVFTAFLTEHC